MSLEDNETMGRERGGKERRKMTIIFSFLFNCSHFFCFLRFFELILLFYLGSINEGTSVRTSPFLLYCFRLWESYRDCLVSTLPLFERPIQRNVQSYWSENSLICFFMFDFCWKSVWLHFFITKHRQLSDIFV